MENKNLSKKIEEKLTEFDNLKVKSQKFIIIAIILIIAIAVFLVKTGTINPIQLDPAQEKLIRDHPPSYGN